MNAVLHQHIIAKILADSKMIFENTFKFYDMNGGGGGLGEFFWRERNQRSKISVSFYERNSNYGS
jgi:hypothetical protein